MEDNKLQNPVTFHGDGTISGNNLIQTNGKNKFMDNYNRIRKTDTEQLLQGLPEFIIKDMVLYFLFDNNVSSFSLKPLLAATPPAATNVLISLY